MKLIMKSLVADRFARASSKSANNTTAHTWTKVMTLIYTAVQKRIQVPRDDVLDHIEEAIGI